MAKATKDDDFELVNDIRSKVYNALSKTAFEIFEQEHKGIDPKMQKKYLEDAVEWWEIHFFDEIGID